MSPTPGPGAGGSEGPALERLAAALGPAAAHGAPLGATTTYRVGGTARLTFTADSEDALIQLAGALDRADARSVPMLVVGNGSNLLVADGGFDGLVVRLGGGLSGIEVRPHPTGGPVVRAGGGAGLPVLARRSVEAGLTGLEWLVGIPGTVGGALRMNAGGHGSDTAACLARWRAIDLADGGRATEAGPAALHLGYRSSSLAATEVVVWAELSGAPGDPVAGRAAISEIVRWRRQHQPGGSNAGSVFVNPEGDSAGRLVESVGLKGHRLGTARVSEKHANFIQADEGGSADDIAALIELVRRTVAERLGVRLRSEVQLVGFASPAGATRMPVQGAA